MTFDGNTGSHAAAAPSFSELLSGAFVSKRWVNVGVGVGVGRRQYSGRGGQGRRARVSKEKEKNPKGGRETEQELGRQSILSK